MGIRFIETNTDAEVVMEVFIDGLGWRGQCRYGKEDRERWSQTVVHKLWSPDTSRKMDIKDLAFPSDLDFSNTLPNGKLERGVMINFAPHLTAEICSLSDGVIKEEVYRRSFKGRWKKMMGELKGGLKWPWFRNQFRV